MDKYGSSTVLLSLDAGILLRDLLEYITVGCSVLVLSSTRFGWISSGVFYRSSNFGCRTSSRPTSQEVKCQTNPAWASALQERITKSASFPTSKVPRRSSSSSMGREHPKIICKHVQTIAPKYPKIRLKKHGRFTPLLVPHRLLPQCTWTRLLPTSYVRSRRARAPWPLPIVISRCVNLKASGSNLSYQGQKKQL